jgi:hypothetical protein
MWSYRLSPQSSATTCETTCRGKGAYLETYNVRHSLFELLAIFRTYLLRQKKRKQLLSSVLQGLGPRRVDGALAEQCNGFLWCKGPDKEEVPCWSTACYLKISRLVVPGCGTDARELGLDGDAWVGRSIFLPGLKVQWNASGRWFANVEI